MAESVQNVLRLHNGNEYNQILMLWHENVNIENISDKKNR